MSVTARLYRPRDPIGGRLCYAAASMAKRSPGGARKRYSIGDGGKIVHNYVVEDEANAFIQPARHDYARSITQVRQRPVGTAPSLKSRRRRRK